MTGTLPFADMAIVLRMMSVLALATWAARPLALRLVPFGGGWVVALLLAWCVLGWVPWLLAALQLAPFGQVALAGLVVLLLIRVWLGAPRGPARAGVTLALAFGLLFWLGLAQRMGHAELSGLEKFTDMAFLAAAMRSDSLPPQDAWYAGEVVNYYYVGQAMAAVWGHLTGARADQAYQIVMAALFALTGLSIWATTAHLARRAGRRLAQGAGALAALLVLYGGNLHSALYTLARPLMPASGAAFYFPDSTRFIGFDPPVDDKGFTEFPAYAFAVGDLHAHVAALPVFFLGLAILMAIVRQSRPPTRLQSAAFGWVLGLCAMMNSWDVAVLGLMGMLAIGLVALRAPTRATFDALGEASVIVAAVALVTAAPFLGWFTPFASGIEPAPARTPLWQWLVLYGHALPPLALFAWLCRYRALPVGVGFLFASALVLLILPEVVIVRDIYGLDYARANTMFKLSFRAQPLLIVAGLATLALALRARMRVFAAVAAVPMLAILAYLPHVFVWPSTIRSLDGLGFLGPERTLVEAAGRLPLAPGEALIEASGPAFGESARVSAMTGQPAMIGWAGHQWLWRNDSDRPNRRAERVALFYTTTDPALRCAIVRRYGLRYAILGQVEYRQYPDLNAEGIRALGPVVSSDAGGQIVQIDAAACR